MRAWLLSDTNGPDSYALAQTATPGPDRGEVRVALRASALNHLDLWVSRGLPAPPSLPHVSGADGAGVVDAIGADVDDVQVGDQVVIDPSTSCGTCRACTHGDVPLCREFRIVGEHRWGTHADAVVVPAENVRSKPPSLSWEQAAAAGLVTSSALRMLRRARFEPGDDVLVVGVGGGTSVAAFLLAISLGAGRVWITSREHAKLAWGVDHGAAGGFHSTEPFDELLRDATGGRGVDVVVENVGTVTFERALSSLARGGRLVTNGSTTGGTAALHLPTLFWRQLEVIGSTMNDHQEFADALQLVGSGAIEIPVDATFGFEEFPAALERLDAGAQLGKIVLAR
ncbi:MAG: alcohol dehydrogenase catalytic domain-containing protein [Actinomycetota bacterium]|nr:alcohol dehydrogenase catalytic domain-containing protein [Actinomycetota bacterium]MDH5314285.1 alcohol dehydrogenase catalytic domain-containing protein [Actinomycetota bacterium]